MQKDDQAKNSQKQTSTLASFRLIPDDDILEEGQTTEATTFMHSQTKEEVNPRRITMIVNANIRNPKSKKHMETNIFLDSGSAFSYINEDTRSKLQLPVRGISWH